MADPSAAARGGRADRPAAGHRVTAPTRWGELKDGLQHVLTTPRLLAPMWLAFLINLTAYPASGGLLPYVARSVYHVDATGLGWLVASFSLGGLLGVDDHGDHRRVAPTRARDACLHRGVVHAAAGLRPSAERGARALLLLAAGFAQNVAMISMTATLITAARGTASAAG